MEPARIAFATDSARVAAPASSRRGPASTAEGRRSRDRVLRASLELIGEVGIDQIRLAEIARRAGMSSGQVMYYFTSKEHILLEALAWLEHEESKRARLSLSKVAGGWRQLKRFVDLYLPAEPVDPVWILWMEAWARAPHNTKICRFLDELARPWREDLARIIETGVREGAFDPPADADDFPVRFCALLNGLAVLRLVQMPNLSRRRLTNLAMNTARAELARHGQHLPVA